MVFGLRFRSVFSFFVVGLATSLALPTLAQTISDVHVDPVSAAKPAATLRTKPLIKNVDLVLVPVTVTDAGGHAVTGLAKNDFTLAEDGRPQPIVSFSAVDGPLSVGVLFDTSKSMKDKVGRTRDALAQFFQAADADDESFLITFSDRPLLLADFTTPGNIQGSLAGAVPHGHTALLDAIYLGLQHLQHARYARKALLIISDGGDNSSRYSESEIRDVVRESDVQIFAIGIFDSIFKTPEEAHGQKLLTDITEATGGRAFVLRNSVQLPAIVDEISLELRSQYVLGYRPPDAARDGRWHKIKVNLTAPSGRHVHARSGYAAPSE